MFFLMCMICTLPMSALEVTIDGLVYDLKGTSASCIGVAFDNHLKTIEVPSSIISEGLEYVVTSIGKSCFCNYYIHSTGGTYYYVEGERKTGDSSMRWTDMQGSTPMNSSYVTKIVLPPTIKTIDNGAFANSNLKEIILREGIESIGTHAFAKTRLTTIIIPSSVKTFEAASWNYNAFEYCDMLRTIIYKGSVAPNNWVATSQTYVPDITSYTHPSYSINSAQILPMIKWEETEFYYTGFSPKIEWTYNIEGYVGTTTSSVHDLEKNSGTWSITMPVTFTKDDESFTVECVYKYTINPVPLTIKAENASRIYGDPNPTFTCLYEGFVGEDTESVLTELPTVTTVANNYSNVGTYDLRVSGGRATNYTLSYQNGTLNITKAPLSAKVDDVTRMYGEKNPSSYSITYFGLKNDESRPAWITKPHVIIEADQSSGVGEYALSTSECEALNYDLKEIASGTLTITPAPLTIQAHDATRKYYSDEPAFSYACYGFVNGDNANVLTSTPTLTTTATLTSSVGTYEIKVGETSTPNYSISYINGTLTITKRTLIASVGNYERAYNEENPAFEVELEGFAGGEDEKVISAMPSAQTLATKTSDVGSYRIDVSGGNADNYNFSYTSGTLTINKAEQTITWNQDLRGLKVGDQVMLNAVASSGLPITYTMEDERFAEVYSVGENYYLDCMNRGKFAMRAVQNGNKNYYSSPRATNNIVISGGTYSDQYVKLSDAGYATFYDEFCDYTLPSGLKASVVTKATESRLSYTTIADGESDGIVPARVAVLLEGKRRSADTYILKPSDTSMTYSGTNLLHGSDDATITTADEDCLFYKLAYGPKGTEWSNVLGWFWGDTDGKPFNIEGHKAWLAIPKSSSVKSRPIFYSIDGNAIELELVEEVASEEGNSEWYDLQGRRVDQPSQRGIYIQNGKKVFVK